MDDREGLWESFKEICGVSTLYYDDDYGDVPDTYDSINQTDGHVSFCHEEGVEWIYDKYINGM